MARNLWIKTYGCQMNVYDSQRMADVLAPLGYQLADSPETADMVILNTCHIREKAAEKVYSELGRIKHLKADREARGGRMVLAVAGCVAQAEGDEILRRAPQVDLVFGPQTYHRLPELVTRVHREGGGIVDTDFPVEPKFDFLPEEQRLSGPSAYLSVQEGCDKFCSFCVVPYTRGAEFSRPVSEVLAEARRLVAVGAVEITLLGQNVNAYHGEGPVGGTWGLGRLIRELAEVDGLRRIRYTTSHPCDMDDELIAAHGDTPALMPYLHLPVQSGSDRILRAMNRRHNSRDYLTIIERLRAVRPGIAMSSDFIVGFPGETAEDFAATLRLVTDVGFAQAYSFKFSPRPGTPAAGAGDQVPESEKGQRLAMLQELLNAQQLSFNQESVGRDLEVLFDGSGRKEGQLVGRSPHMQAVHLEASPADADRVRGRIARVRVTSAHPNSVGAIFSPQADGVPADETMICASTMRAEGRF